MLSGVINKAVIRRYLNAVFMAKVNKIFYFVGIFFKVLVHNSRFCREIAKPDMGLKIYHGVVRLAFLKIFNVSLWREA